MRKPVLPRPASIARLALACVGLALALAACDQDVYSSNPDDRQTFMGGLHAAGAAPAASPPAAPAAAPH